MVQKCYCESIIPNFNKEQIKLVSSFFSNLSIVWFAAALINPANIDTSIKFAIDAIISLSLAVYLLKGIES